MEKVYPEKVEGGHDGADTLIMQDFIQQVKSNESKSTSSAMVSAKSHLIAFAAEESRVTGNTIDMSDYINQLKNSASTV